MSSNSRGMWWSRWKLNPRETKRASQICATFDSRSKLTWCFQRNNIVQIIEHFDGHLEADRRKRVGELSVEICGGNSWLIEMLTRNWCRRLLSLPVRLASLSSWAVCVDFDREILIYWWAIWCSYECTRHNHRSSDPKSSNGGIFLHFQFSSGTAFECQAGKCEANIYP